VRSADKRAAAASRVMSLAIAFTSLAIAALAAARRVAPALDAQAAQWGTLVGACVIALVAASYVIAMRLAPRPAKESTWNA
jgi:high-affinity nickel-transport protein